jgi:hypothetical protein
VPEVRDTDLSSAKAQLASRNLRYRLVWRLTDAASPGQVLEQIPSAGATVYQGAQIRLTVARTLRWVKVFSASGTDEYESDVFTVPERWRIRYRLVPNEFGLAVAQIGWAGEGDGSTARSFLASGAGALRTYVSSDGAGTFKLVVRPYAGTHWYVEVDALK